MRYTLLADIGTFYCEEFVPRWDLGGGQFWGKGFEKKRFMTYL
jgi:hypothetical protein